MSFNFLAGFPPTSVLATTSLVTTEPEAMTALSPIVTPGLIIAPPPIQTLLPILISLPNSAPDILVCASNGCVAV